MGRKRVRYSANTNKRRVRRKAVDALTQLAGEDWPQLVHDLVPSEEENDNVELQYLQQLQANVSALMVNIPQNSSARRVLLTWLTKDIPRQQASQLTECSIATIQRAKKSQPELIQHLTLNVPRTSVKVPIKENTWIRNWLHENAPVRSGTENIQILPWSTWRAVHLHYRYAIAGLQFPTRSFSFIRKMTKKLHIRLEKSNIH